MSGNVATPVLIEKQRDIGELCAEVRRAGRFALDTEFVMEDVYAPDLCLMQIATPGRVFLLDLKQGLDVTAVWDLVADERIETVVHAGHEDLALCAHAIGRPPRNVFDVQIAAGFVGPTFPLSLSRLVQQTLHIRLHKSQTLTDWRKRPLSSDQIRYAGEDVVYLLAVREALGTRLAKLKRADWAREECLKFENMELYRRTGPDHLQRVRGAGSLQGTSLNIASALVAWRDALAVKLNRPPRTILKDHLMIEIARHGWTSPEQIRTLRGINLRKDHMLAMCEVVRTAAEKPAAPRSASGSTRNEHPHDQVLVSLLTAVLRNECARLNLAYSLVATKRSILDLVEPFVDGASVSELKGAELLSGWRDKAVGATLRQILSGSRVIQVSVDDKPGTLRYISLPPSTTTVRRRRGADRHDTDGVAPPSAGSMS